MPSIEQIERALLEYCRDYIRAQRARDRSFHDIAKQLDVSHVWVMAILERGRAKSVSRKIEILLARALHGGSIDQLHRAALNVHLGGLVVVEDNGQPVQVTRSEPPPASARGLKPRGKRSAR